MSTLFLFVKIMEKVIFVIFLHDEMWSLQAGPLRKKNFFEAKKNPKKNVATKLEEGHRP